MPRIIFVTDLTLWSMGKDKGGPAFTKTVEAYSSAGYDVWLVSDVDSNQNSSLVDKRKNIIVRPSIFKKLIHLRKIGIIFRILDHIIVTTRFEKELKRILSCFEGQTVLYAYEIFGVKACFYIAQRFTKTVTVSRFQGTILSEEKNSLINHLRFYPHFQALGTETNLLIMTNDGTRGDYVLRSIQNKSDTLFLLNGLDLFDRDIDSLVSNIDINRFKMEKLSINDSKSPVFLTVSRLEKWKRIDRALDGFSDYLSKKKNGYLVIVGDGSERVSLEKRAKEKGIFERVKFVGAVPHDDVYNYMMASDVFMSLYNLSNVGNPLLEAMALGKAIITYDVGDTKEFIKDGENGFLLSDSELSNLGKKMEILARDGSLRRQFGNKASEFAQLHFWDWNHRMNYEIEEVRALMEGGTGEKITNAHTSGEVLEVA